MDFVLAILVLGAIIFFGALISVGNERQRKAVEGIREQTALWAMQDLRLKREKLAREVRVDDPLGWLNQMIAKVTGEDLDLTVTEVFENPQALVCTEKDSRTIILSPASPKDIKKFRQATKSKLSRIGTVHPLMLLSKKVDIVELSMLNGGVLFDLELKIAWKLLTGVAIHQDSSLFLYIH